MAKGWAKFPYADGKYVYTGATLKKAWNRLHLGDQEPLPKDAAVVDAWIAFHAGEFERAAKAGLAAGGAGITAANKATAIYANYLEDDEKRKLALFEDVAARAEKQQAPTPSTGRPTRSAATRRASRSPRRWRRASAAGSRARWRRRSGWRRSMPTRTSRWLPITPR